MAIGESQFSLFGTASPEEVRQAIGKAAQAQDLAIAANVPRGRMMVASAANTGRLFGNVAEQLGGYVDPRVQEAQKLQQAQQATNAQAKAMGIDMMNNPEQYLKLAGMNLQNLGLTNHAMTVAGHLQALQQQNQKMQILQQNANATTATSAAAIANANTNFQKLQAAVTHNQNMEGIATQKNQLLKDANAYKKAASDAAANKNTELAKLYTLRAGALNWLVKNQPKTAADIPVAISKILENFGTPQPTGLAALITPSDVSTAGQSGMPVAGSGNVIDLTHLPK